MIKREENKNGRTDEKKVKSRSKIDCLKGLELLPLSLSLSLFSLLTRQEVRTRLESVMRLFLSLSLSFFSFVLLLQLERTRRREVRVYLERHTRQQHRTTGFLSLSEPLKTEEGKREREREKITNLQVAMTRIPLLFGFIQITKGRSRGGELIEVDFSCLVSLASNSSFGFLFPSTLALFLYGSWWVFYIVIARTMR